MTEETSQQRQGPVKTFRHGAISASIWKRERPDGSEYLDFSLTRSWRSQDGGKYGYSSNFFASNEAELSTVVQDACQWIAKQESGSSNSPNSAGETDTVPTAA